MRIAQVAPLYESVPPQAYGATERIVAYLCDALVALGHEVTLYASADSCTAAQLVPVCRRGLWRDSDVWDTLSHHLRQLGHVAAAAADFDLIHFHGEPLHFPLAQQLAAATLTTMHGRLLPADHGPLLQQFADVPLVSISDDQRRALAHGNWRRTIHHGLPPDAMPFAPRGGDYLLWLGRMMPEKRPELAIEIARRSGLPLKMAAAVHPGERGYFRERVEPLLRASRGFVDYLGEVGGARRQQLFANARALLFPIDWPEPFGLVMVEAMSAGTPVIAFRRGAVPEVLEHGVAGFVVDSIDEAVEAVAAIGTLSRSACRDCFERRFTAARMARDYLAEYEALAGRR
jgi:glycosyltransferase involved in cell wall biosynthesis